MSFEDEEIRRIRIGLTRARIRAIDMAAMIDKAIKPALSHAEAISILTQEPFAFSVNEADAVLQMSAFQRTNAERRKLVELLDSLCCQNP